MDYAGRDFRNIRYPTDRILTEAERASRYPQGIGGNADPNDYLSVIKVNSTYMDLVDRWYPTVGFNVWFGSCVGGVSILILVGMYLAIFVFRSSGGVGSTDIIGLIVFSPLCLLFVCAGVWLVKLEALGWTHYPMRLNRKTRQVHVFRQDGKVMTVPWDDLYIVRGQAKSFLADTSFDLRAHVLDADGETVRHSFSLGYAFLGDQNAMDRFWAFLQPYMEAPDGVAQTQRVLEKHGTILPLDGRREGWRWSIVRSFMFAAHWPWLQFLGAPFLGLNAMGRMFAMWTSKQPEWPAEVEAVSTVDVDDPYQRTWRQNPPLGWWEFHWPLICTVTGVGSCVGIIGWTLATLATLGG